MAAATPERGLDTHKSPETVVQPSKALQLEQVDGLSEFVDQINQIKEHASDTAGEQWSGNGTSQKAIAATGQQQAASARDMAMANLPPARTMQKELEKHIKEEVKKLRKQAKTITRIGQPGGAHKLTLLYRQIRHLNSLLAAIWDTSLDVLKRLFVRVFVDKQSIQ